MPSHLERTKRENRWTRQIHRAGAWSTYGYSIDIRLMAGKCLFTHAFSYVPQLVKKKERNDQIDRSLPITLAEASHAPETNVFMSGDIERDITSPVCPWKLVVCWPVSISHRALEETEREDVKTNSQWHYAPGHISRTGDNLRIIEETTAW